jgi:hypothetical protein
MRGGVKGTYEKYGDEGKNILLPARSAFPETDPSVPRFQEINAKNTIIHQDN